MPKRFHPIFTLALLLISGCHFAAPKPKEEQSAAKAMHSDRLKRDEIGIPPLTVFPDGSLMADGIWIPEPDDSTHGLVFPEQTRITCNKGEQNCTEIEIRFVVVGNIITAKGPEETLWTIKSWDRNSLVAEYGPFPKFKPDPDSCQKHVLSIVFASGTVTTSDIPAPRAGCEPFTETTSYRLASGWYNVDVSPNNNAIESTETRK
ncbi:MAG: hypothetical protein ABR923_22175 [Terracidiphilus sp.]|jgi:hypothetical protein